MPPETPAEWIINDEAEDRCFGCGQRNPRGLRLVFRVCAEGEVEAKYAVPEEFAGSPGVVHGGIQAALLDEALGHAIHASVSDINVVTADLQLRYRRPTPSATPLLIRGHVLRVEGRDYYTEGEICSAEGEILTRAASRWRHID